MAHPELNGLLLRNPDDGAIYLILDGFLRHIKDVATKNGLFNDDPATNKKELIMDLLSDGSSIGADIAHGSFLGRTDGTPSVFFVDVALQEKRHIKDPPTAAKYHFDLGKQKVFDFNGPLDAIPTGPEIV
jgi:hypothetical protein